jgi:two-component system NtrC family response regulator
MTTSGGAALHLLGQSEAMQSIRSQIASIAHRSATVLIEGETGVGKEIAAREIHARSRRADGAFMPVDCTAFSSQLIESQLFGHVKGAFTGAVSAALGFVRCADGGTLFLDEIGELPLDVQAKLLRCIQERTVIPVGGVGPIAVNLRIVAATHRDLAAMVRQGTFREDLYFRINVVRLTIPPLRDRRDDVVSLAHHFLRELAQFYEEPVKKLTIPAEDALVRYDWPGNVRELRNAVERALLYCNELAIDVAHLPLEVNRAGQAPSQATLNGTGHIPSLAEAERMLIARVLRASKGNKSQAARMLKIERQRLQRLITRHGLAHLLANGRG